MSVCGGCVSVAVASYVCMHVLLFFIAWPASHVTTDTAYCATDTNVDVVISIIHGAKGMEWDNVQLFASSMGSFPTRLDKYSIHSGGSQTQRQGFFQTGINLKRNSMAGFASWCGGARVLRSRSDPSPRVASAWLTGWLAVFVGCLLDCWLEVGAAGPAGGWLCV